jgi:hypothetical protein
MRDGWGGSDMEAGCTALLLVMTVSPGNTPFRHTLVHVYVPHSVHRKE